VKTKLVLLAASVLLLGGCGEKPQTMTTGSKPDAPAWQQVPSVNVDPGWNTGDRKAWEEHLKVRTQRGQNEYTRGSSGQS
jgi:uncharacterized lipoprotein YajG